MVATLKGPRSNALVTVTDVVWPQARPPVWTATPVGAAITKLSCSEDTTLGFIHTPLYLSNIMQSSIKK